MSETQCTENNLETPPIVEVQKKNLDNLADSESKVNVRAMSTQERLAMRAQRFGHCDKLKQRAARFGVSLDNSKISKQDILKKRVQNFTSRLNNNQNNQVDSETLKKRAQRFGIVSEKAKKLDIEEKLLKRQKRFNN